MDEHKFIGSFMNREKVIVFFLICITGIGFFQVLHHDFVYYDDGLYVTENAQVQEGLTWEGVQWAFTTTHASNWHPLTWLSHMLDAELFGLNPMGHHLINLLFHVANTVLLFLFLRRTTGAFWRSAVVSALFGIHPLHVESVAWVAERKDLLSTFFWLLTMFCYVQYVKTIRWRPYLLAVLCMALGLMAKPMLVTVPFVLLLLDFWPLRRSGSPGAFPKAGKNNGVDRKRHDKPISIKALIAEKIPFFMLSIGSCMATVIAQGSGTAVASLEALSLNLRIYNALVSYVKYIWKTVWPHNLTILYTYPTKGFPIWQVTTAAIFLLLITGLAIRFAKRYPYFLFGWLWFLGTLIPVIGLVQAGSQPMADRYTYVPLIGLFISGTWGIHDGLAKRRNGMVFLGAVSGVILFCLTMATWFQVSQWHNSLTLFQDAIAVSPDSAIVNNNLGFALAREGRFHDAIRYYREALRLKPSYVTAQFNLGLVLGKVGKPEEAIFHFTKALHLKPDSPATHYYIGVAYMQTNRLEKGKEHLLHALQLSPDYAEAHNELGVLLAKQGHLKQAKKHFSKALAIQPTFQQAESNLHRALRQLGVE